MSAATVEFMGGPLHGQVCQVPANDHGVPQPTYRVAVNWSTDWSSPADAMVLPDVVDYTLSVSDLDDGPLWVYLAPVDARLPACSDS